MMAMVVKKLLLKKLSISYPKKFFNIDGLEKIIESFWELKLIRYPQDIFNLDFEKISSLDGWKTVSCKSLNIL